MAKTTPGTTNDTAVDQVQGLSAVPTDMVKETKETKTVVIPETGPAQMTLGQIVGQTMTAILDDGHGKRMPAFRNQFTVWYNAQTPDDRKANALEIKKRLELARSVVEAIYEHFRMVSMVDTNA